MRLYCQRIGLLICFELCAVRHLHCKLHMISKSNYFYMTHFKAFIDLIVNHMWERTNELKGWSPLVSEKSAFPLMVLAYASSF